MEGVLPIMTHKYFKSNTMLILLEVILRIYEYFLYANGNFNKVYFCGRCFKNLL
jgi:hypothetical protein